jgi:hypothetical protein
MVAIGFNEQSFKTADELLNDKASPETTRHVWLLKETMDEQLKEEE